MSDGDRPQDVDRSHKRRTGGDPRDDAILERYRAALRAELEDLLAELRPASGQMGAFDGGAIERPSLDRRRALWDLGIKIAKELGAVPLELGWSADTLDATPAPKPRGAPRLTAAQRRALGADA